MLDFLKNQKNYLFLILALLIVFGLGFTLGKNNVVCKVCPPEDVDFSLFWEAWHTLQDEYISPENFDIEKMIYGAISGMVKSLGDPYTVFFDPDETEDFLENISGRFEGIGMEIGIKDGQLQVIAPLEKTPAQEAGLRPGDKIIKIEDELTMDFTVEQAVMLIRGPRGTEVNLTILREEWDSPKEFRIKRAIIEVPSLKWEIFEQEGQYIAYIKIYHFDENADTDFLRAVNKILKTSARKVILDLRSNPGGYLEVAESIASWFLEKDSVIVIEDFGGKQEQKIHKAKGNSWLFDYPVVILINEGTASASEILASAISENREDAKIVGKTSFGKGSVQELASLSNDSSLKITIANWLTPLGNLLTEKGVEPDIDVKMTDEDYENDRDPQLDRAIEVIREMR